MLPLPSYLRDDKLDLKYLNYYFIVDSGHEGKPGQPGVGHVRVPRQTVDPERQSFTAVYPALFVLFLLNFVQLNKRLFKNGCLKRNFIF